MAKESIATGPGLTVPVKSPSHSTNFQSARGTAVRVTRSPWKYLPSTGAGSSTTWPRPSVSMVTATLAAMFSNLALTLLSLSMVMVATGLSGGKISTPSQPASFQPASGTAVRVTTVPGA